MELMSAAQNQNVTSQVKFPCYINSNYCIAIRDHTSITIIIIIGESHCSAGKWSVVFCCRIFGINMTFDQEIGHFLSHLGDALTLMNEEDEATDIEYRTDESEEFVDSFETFDDRYNQNEGYDDVDGYLDKISQERYDYILLW